MNDNTTTRNAATLHAEIMLAASAAPCETEKNTGTRLVAFKTASGKITLKNTRQRLQQFAADMLKGNTWALFCGGAKPASETKAKRARAAWSAHSVKLVAELLEDGNRADAVSLAEEKAGAMFYMHGGNDPFMTWAPEPVEGLPTGFVSGRAEGGAWRVWHQASGLRLSDNKRKVQRSRRAAEVDAVRAWEFVAEEHRAGRLHGLQPCDTDAARAEWLKLHGIASVEAAQACKDVAEVVAEAVAMAAIEQAQESAAVAELSQCEEVQRLAEPLAVCEMAGGGASGGGMGQAHAASHARPSETLGQRLASKTPGAWSARLWIAESGAAMLEFSSGEDGAPVVHEYDGRPERMRDLQRMAQAADFAAMGSRQQTAKPSPDFDPDTCTGEEVRALHPTECTAWLDRLTEHNFHGEALAIRCMRAGRDDLAQRVREINRKHNEAGHLTPELAEQRRAIGDALKASRGEAPDFQRARPVKIDIRQIVASGVGFADLVGLGVNYSGDMANESGAGAIIEAAPCKYYGLRLTVGLEDGRQWQCDPSSFSDSPGSRFAFNWKHHGAPYLAQLTGAHAAKKAADSAREETQAKTRADERARLEAEYPQLHKADGRHGGGVHAAKNIRILLRQKFKGVKFSVRSDYSSCRVNWTDGPTEAQVNEVIGRFDIGASDTMTDYFYTVSTAWSDAFGGVQYLFTSREESIELVAKALAEHFPSEDERPSVEDWKQARGVFAWCGGNEWTRRKFAERLHGMTL
nr:MAG TPA_asm: Large polyvalent protein associated domain 29 [Bacteriophage sp.]